MTTCQHCGLERATPEHDCVESLGRIMVKLQQRLYDQTLATQEAAEYWHNAVLERLEGRIPDGIDPHGHPIDQIVATVLSRMDAKVERLRAEVKRLRILAGDRDRCPSCNYTHQDARTLMDHRLCGNYPYFEDEGAAEAAKGGEHGI